MGRRQSPMLAARPLCDVEHIPEIGVIANRIVAESDRTAKGGCLASACPSAVGLGGQRLLDSVSRRLVNAKLLSGSIWKAPAMIS